MKKNTCGIVNKLRALIPALIIAISGMAFSAPVYAGAAGEAEIATWRGFRKGAASFTFDDGAHSHVSDAGPLFKKYGYKATFNLVYD